MGRFFAFSVLLAFAGLTVVSCQVQFPCDHFLRNLPSLAPLFQHCLCRYENSSEVIPIAGPPISVPRSECESGVKIPGILYQNGVSCSAPGCDVCPVKNVSEFVCKPDCLYLNGSDVIPIENAISIRVLPNQCRSEYAFPAKQYLVAVGGFECNETWCSQCENKSTSHFICEPPLEERLIMTFDIGGDGQDTTSLWPEPIRCTRQGGSCRIIWPPPIRTPDSCDTSREICPDTSHRGRRSLLEEIEEMPPPQRKEPQPLPVDPLPFDHTKHHTRYRRQARSSNCEDPNSERHILFILDTSGSIGSNNFHMMTDSVSKLVRHFCRKIKVAMMVFNHDHYLEFCFDCFDNTCVGRRAARDRITSVPYRRGGTHTASATQCACDNILTSSCGFEASSTNEACLDVIYITDGRSNDPILEVCDVVDCLYNKTNTDVTVYAFGIGDTVNETELNCIARNRNSDGHSVGNSIFRVPDFQSFSDGIGLLEGVFSSNRVGCFTSHQSAPGGVTNVGLCE